MQKSSSCSHARQSSFVASVFFFNLVTFIVEKLLLDLLGAILLGYAQVRSLVGVSVLRFVLVHGAGLQSICHQLGLSSWASRFDVLVLHFAQVKLLRPQDWARPSDSYPPDECLSRDLEVFHCPNTNQGTSPPQPCLAVDSNCFVQVVIEVTLDHVHELINYVVWWGWTINKKEIIVSYAVVGEGLLVVLLFVQSDYLVYS